MKTRLFMLAVAVGMPVLAPASAALADSVIQLPSVDAIRRVMLMQDYNTRVVFLGTMLLGVGAGIIGSFMLLQKRSLMGDALSHATLPGIGIAFMIMAARGGDGKWLPGLLLGALVSGLAGVGLILLIRNFTRLKEDAALGIVLSVFFGFGIAVLGVIQKMSTGNAAGLESFIYGKTASMLASDAALIAAAAAVVVTVCLVLFKEFSVVCFDRGYAAAQGWPVWWLDLVMTGLVVGVTVIGLQAVGLILIVALLIIPAAAARFWTDHLPRMVVMAGVLGGLSGLIGAAFSALVPRMPAGAIIVVVASLLFVVSMFLGPSRGVLVRWLRHRQLRWKIGLQNLLRALYEWFEDDHQRAGMPWTLLEQERSWSPYWLRRLARVAQKKGWIYRAADGGYRLSEQGATEAWRVVRNHRLWELYLIAHADIAPSHVDRDADQLEHVLGRSMVRKLEALLEKDYPHLVMPRSPHILPRQEDPLS